MAGLSFAPGDELGSFVVVGQHGCSDTVHRYVVRGRGAPAGAGDAGILKVAAHPHSFLRGARLERMASLLGRTAPFALEPVDVEINALERCRHPSLPPILEYGRKGYSSWAVSPYYADFANLLEVLPALGDRQRLAVMDAIWAGVKHMHQRGVVHRDLKLSNVLVAPGLAGWEDGPCEWPVRVVDFELALTDGVGVPGVTGTAAYRSPEQWAGDELSQIDDARTDLFALGVVSAALVMGERPARPETALGVQGQWTQRLDRSATAISGGVLSASIIAMLSPRRDERSHAVASFEAGLDEVWSRFAGGRPQWLDAREGTSEPPIIAPEALPVGLTTACQRLGLDPQTPEGARVRMGWRSAGLATDHDSAAPRVLTGFARDDGQRGLGLLRERRAAADVAGVLALSETGDDDARGVRSLPYRAWALHATGQEDAARECLTRALARDVSAPDLLAAGSAWRALDEVTLGRGLGRLDLGSASDWVDKAVLLTLLGAWRAALGHCAQGINDQDLDTRYALGRLMLEVGVAVERLIAGQPGTAPPAEVFSCATVGAVFAALVDADVGWFDAILSGHAPDPTWLETAALTCPRALALEPDDEVLAVVQRLLAVDDAGASGRDVFGGSSAQVAEGSLLYQILIECLADDAVARRELAASWALIELGLGPFVIARWQRFRAQLDAPRSTGARTTFACVVALAHATGITADVGPAGADASELERRLAHPNPIAAWSGSLATPLDRLTWHLALADHGAFEALRARSERLVRSAIAPPLFFAAPRPTEVAWVASRWFDALLGAARWEDARALIAAVRAHRPGVVASLRGRLGRFLDTHEDAVAPAESLLSYLAEHLAGGVPGALAAASPPPPDVRGASRSAAVASLVAGDLDESLRETLDNLTQSPHSAGDWLNGAAALYRAGELEWCEHAAFKCIQYGPGLVGGWIYLLRVRAERGEGLDDWLLREALERHPSHPEIARRVARIFAGQGRLAPAREALERSLLTTPADSEAWALLADVCAQTGDRDGALTAARNALRGDPGDPELRQAVRRIYEQLGRHEEIKTMFRRQKAPSLDELERQLESALAMGDAVLAGAVAAKVLERDATHNRALSTLLSACVRGERYADACVFGLELLQSKPSTYDQMMLAFALLESGAEGDSARLADLYLKRPGGRPAVARVAARIGVVNASAVDTWSVRDVVVHASLAEAIGAEAWSDTLMWVSHMVAPREAEVGPAPWTGLASWLESLGRPGEALAALILAEKACPGAVEAGRFDALQGLLAGATGRAGHEN